MRTLILVPPASGGKRGEVSFRLWPGLLTAVYLGGELPLGATFSATNRVPPVARLGLLFNRDR